MIINEAKCSTPRPNRRGRGQNSDGTPRPGRDLGGSGVDLTPRLGDTAGGLGGGSPPAGSRGRAMVGGLGAKCPEAEAEAYLSTLKYNIRCGEMKCHEINIQRQLDLTPQILGGTLVIVSPRSKYLWGCVPLSHSDRRRWTWPVLGLRQCATILQRHSTAYSATSTMNVNHGGRRGTSSPEFGVGVLMQIVPSPDFQQIPLTIHQNTPFQAKIHF